MGLTPYYDEDGVTIYHGEALDILRQLPDAAVAAVVADPPYSSGGAFRADRQADPSTKYRGWSQGADGGSVAPKSTPGSFTGDSRDQRGYAYWSALWMSQACRVSSVGAQCFVFTDWRQLPTTTDAVQAGGWSWRGVLVWDKGVGRPMKGRFRNHLEYVVWSSSGPMPSPDDVYPSTLLRHSPPGHAERVHVTQKPEGLIREILSVAPPGLALDPFMGSGTTLRAAKDLGRKVIGIEQDEAYCEIAARRLAQTVLDLGEAS
ncbi:MAG TPA: site-specific DNA-methyltransferase [Aquihabitans sp.]|jgi:site-specific DNA-methyltransferase (adenine-specific)|nr:site-specific DNA-methyltransferase [Aquihabitans sp.]